MASLVRARATPLPSGQRQHGLNPDILLLIFAELSEPGGSLHPKQPPLNIIGVNAHWRSVAFQCQALWSTIRIYTSPDSFLRSQGKLLEALPAPRQLVLDTKFPVGAQDHTWSTPEVMSAVGSAFNRVSGNLSKLVVESDFHNIFPHIPFDKLHLLEYLSIRCGTSVDMLSSKLWSAASLVRLVLRGLGDVRDAPYLLCNQLTHLALISSSLSRVAVYQFPRLIHLTVDSVHFNFKSTPDAILPIPLPLRSLSFQPRCYMEDGPYELLPTHFHGLNPSHLASVSLNLPWRGGAAHIGSLQRFLQQCPVLERLRILGTHMNKVQFQGIASGSPGVRHLELSHEFVANLNFALKAGFWLRLRRVNVIFPSNASDPFVSQPLPSLAPVLLHQPLLSISTLRPCQIEISGHTDDSTLHAYPLAQSDFESEVTGWKESLFV